MPKLARKNQKIFAESAPAGLIKQYGSLAEGAPLTTTDPEVIQALATRYAIGWQAAAITSGEGNIVPALEDFNALAFLFSYQLFYLFEQGIAEWDDSTTYYIDSICRSGNILYRSLTDNNLNNDPTSDTTNWKIYFVSDQYAVVGGNNIINASFNVWQNGTSFVAGSNDDDSYTADQWILLSDGNDIADITKETGAEIPTTQEAAMKLEVETASKKFGIFQPIEQKDCKHLAGGKVSLSFLAKTSGSTIANVRAMVVSWDGAADTITSDIVSAWNGFGTNPTLVANWTAENTASNLAITDSWSKLEITGIDIDTSGTKNIGLFIWVDEDSAINDLLYLSEIQLVKGEEAIPFDNVPIQQDLQKCQRFYENDSFQGIMVSANVSGGQWIPYSSQQFLIQKRISPSMSYAGTPQWYNSGVWTNFTAIVSIISLSADLRDHHFGATYVPTAGANLAWYARNIDWIADSRL